jgi:hypothetical protein
VDDVETGESSSAKRTRLIIVKSSGMSGVADICVCESGRRVHWVGGHSPQRRSFS